jgi:hypothetical protein
MPVTVTGGTIGGIGSGTAGSGTVGTITVGGPTTTFPPGWTNPGGPPTVALDGVAGGFDSVVEIAAPACLRYMSSQVPLPSIMVRLTAANAPALKGLKDPVLSVVASILTNHPGVAIYAGVVFHPIQLQFPPNRVQISYSGEVGVGGVGPNATGAFRFVPTPVTSSWLRALAVAAGGPGPFIGYRIDPALAWTLALALTATIDAPNVQVQVRAHAPGAVGNVVTQGGNSQAIWAGILEPHAGGLLRGFPQPSVLAIPTISLTGRNVPVQVATEFPAFDAVLTTPDSNTLAVCMTVQPGIQGSVASVQNFVGDEEYGVISDAYVVERVFKNQWRLGGFMRSLTTAVNVMINYKNQIQPATITSLLNLSSLDNVELVTDSDTRSDCLLVGGAASGTIQSVTLQDNTKVTPQNPTIDISNWGLLTQPSVSPPALSNAQAQAYSTEFGRSGYRHIACPFAADPIDSGGPTVHFGELDAALQRVGFLGYLGDWQ